MGYCREPAREIPPMTRSCRGDLTGKPDQDSRDSLDLLEHLPQTKICLSTVYYIMLSPTLLTLTGGYPRLPFSGENQLRALVISLLGMKGAFQLKLPC